MRQLLFLISLLVLVGCVGRAPLEDYTLAYTAIESARAAQAPRIAPGHFSRAEEFYHQALVEFEDRKYSDAKADFLRAKQFAERAENYSALHKAETGDGE